MEWVEKATSRFIPAGPDRRIAPPPPPPPPPPSLPAPAAAADLPPGQEEEPEDHGDDVAHGGAEEDPHVAADLGEAGEGGVGPVLLLHVHDGAEGDLGRKQWRVRFSENVQKAHYYSISFSLSFSIFLSLSLPLFFTLSLSFSLLFLPRSLSLYPCGRGSERTSSLSLSLSADLLSSW